MILKELHETGITLLTSRTVFRDARGYFLEARKESQLRNIINAPFVQTNVSKSAPFVIRGMHYQLGKPCGKLVRCVYGHIYQVSVDVRDKSPTFGKWWAHHLTGDSGDCVWVPPGHANGFYTFEQGAIVMYEMTAEYDAKLDCSLFWKDPEVGIDWPFGPGANLVISEKDQNAKRLSEITRWVDVDANAKA